MRSDNYCGVSNDWSTFVFAEPHFVEALSKVKDRLYMRTSGSSIEYDRDNRVTVKFSTNFKHGGYRVEVMPWCLFHSAEDGKAWLVPYSQLARPDWELVAVSNKYVVLHGEIRGVYGARARLCEDKDGYYYTIGGSPHSPTIRHLHVVENWAQAAVRLEDAVTAYRRVCEEDRRNFLQRVCDVSIDIKFK